MTHSKNITKERKARGFSLGELREANVSVNRANSLGIILDFRRGTVRESNVALLKDILNKNIEAKKQRKIDSGKQTQEVKEKAKPEKVKKKVVTKKVAPKKEEIKEEVEAEVKPVKAKKTVAKKAAPKKKATEEKKTEGKEVKPDKAKKTVAKKAAPKKAKKTEE
ncbi:MAG: 50S ribosomal protein L13e [Candidatus Methanofastidiosum methylothiophilum]|uniref:50S ribosomal protein L13e n=1 Tax=Candidatus Methanofastidiosum methylothiophilum TaxID=1705564 RepID=A0A150ILC4_9EURY|nr:MAG: 50S ribosomal protein L13e [Candidatus Methanofastidiosum methylthiophilus]KYC47887.1 MAG: 50S ribosomal protein L13e [Candidatus Methanofastidiosum methylthiophilus]KYC49028.1 MAG: 50S ribosomal protein L13e [Candidatus Methanofastidiosum methylthiophilus]